MLQLKAEVMSRSYNLFKVESNIQIQLFNIYFQSKISTSIFLLLKHKFRREKHGLETCWSNTANFSLMLCNYNNG